jgi:FAD/FMN-containing dehydrogenase
MGNPRRISPMPPDAVAYPETTAEVSDILRICAAQAIAVIGWGIGTALEGHALAPKGGLGADFARMAARAVRLGGTVSGEHGIALGRRKYMQAEHGAAWEVRGALKAALDPAGILNPGKLLP